MKFHPKRKEHKAKLSGACRPVERRSCNRIRKDSSHVNLNTWLLNKNYRFAYSKWLQDNPIESYPVEESSAAFQAFIDAWENYQAQIAQQENEIGTTSKVDGSADGSVSQENCLGGFMKDLPSTPDGDSAG